jgi:hypothetical protein
MLKRPQFFSHESVLLHAFLAFNDAFAVTVSLSMLHHGRREELGAILENYAPAAHEDGLEVAEGHFPSSAYIRRVRS